MVGENDSHPGVAPTCVRGPKSSRAAALYGLCISFGCASNSFLMTFSAYCSYTLSKEHPQSQVLDMMIKKISDAGFRSEIAGVTSVANQHDVFSVVLADCISQCLRCSEDELQEPLGKLVQVLIYPFLL